MRGGGRSRRARWATAGALKTLSLHWNKEGPTGGLSCTHTPSNTEGHEEEPQEIQVLMMLPLSVVGEWGTNKLTSAHHTHPTPTPRGREKLPELGGCPSPSSKEVSLPLSEGLIGGHGRRGDAHMSSHQPGTWGSWCYLPGGLPAQAAPPRATRVRSGHEDPGAITDWAREASRSQGRTFLWGPTGPSHSHCARVPA